MGSGPGCVLSSTQVPLSMRGVSNQPCGPCGFAWRWCVRTFGGVTSGARVWWQHPLQERICPVGSRMRSVPLKSTIRQLKEQRCSPVRLFHRPSHTVRRARPFIKHSREAHGRGTAAHLEGTGSCAQVDCFQEVPLEGKGLPGAREAAWFCLPGWVSGFPVPRPGGPCRVCLLLILLIPRGGHGPGVCQQAGHSFFLGQCCRAAPRASVTRSTFSRVALQPSRPIRSTWGARARLTSTSRLGPT